MNKMEEKKLIPTDCWSIILSFLPFKDHITVQKVCKFFHSTSISTKFPSFIPIYLVHQGFRPFTTFIREFEGKKFLFLISPAKNIRTFSAFRIQSDTMLGHCKLYVKTFEEEKIFETVDEYMGALDKSLSFLCKLHYDYKNTFTIHDIEVILRKKMKMYDKIKLLVNNVNMECKDDQIWFETKYFNYLKKKSKMSKNKNLVEKVKDPNTHHYVRILV